MKLLCSKEKKIIDISITKKESIKSIILMERVALNIASIIVNKYDLRKKSFIIICGQGNNGGDGLALARILSSINVQIHVFFLNFSQKTSENCKSNLELFNKKYPDKISIINSTKDFSLTNCDIIIDAIFGIGLNKVIEGNFAEIIHKINNFAKEFKKDVFSIDIPSGLFCENNPNNGTIIKANTTFFINTPPLSAMFAENYGYFGHLEKINLSTKKIIDEIFEEEFFHENNEKSYHIINDDYISKIFPIRNDYSHKNSFGHPLLIAGSYGKAGAAVLSARACLKSGIGLLTAYIPISLIQILQSSIPELMIDVDSNEKYSSLNNVDIKKYKTFGIGPGLSINDETVSGMQFFLSKISKYNKNNSIRLVFDADALNCLAKIKKFQDLIPQNSILTPHPKEFERLFGKFNNSYDKIEFLLNFCKRTQSVVILKNAITTIVTPNNEVFFNIGNNSGIAKAGSGDVLTGILTAFQAQYENPSFNAILAVYLHSYAGKIASEKMGKFSMIATDIIDNINVAFKKFEILNS